MKNCQPSDGCIVHGNLLARMRFRYIINIKLGKYYFYLDKELSTFLFKYLCSLGK